MAETIKMNIMVPTFRSSQSNEGKQHVSKKYHVYNGCQNRVQVEHDQREGRLKRERKQCLIRS